jgi:hypothetical protein
MKSDKRNIKRNNFYSKAHNNPVESIQRLSTSDDIFHEKRKGYSLPFFADNCDYVN